MQVPTYGAPRIQQDPAAAATIGTINLNASAASFGAKQADQLEKLGNQLVNTGTTIMEQQNQAIVRDAINQAREQSRTVITDALSRQGENAFGATDETKERFQKIKEEVSKKFNMPAQHQMFSAVFDSYASGNLDNIFSHETGEKKKFDIQTLQAANENNFNDLALDFGDAAKREQNLKEIMANTAAIGQRQGWSDEVYKAETAKAENAFHLTVAENMANADPAQAVEYLDANQAKIDPQKYAAMKQRYQRVATDNFAYNTATAMTAKYQGNLAAAQQELNTMIGKKVGGVTVTSDMVKQTLSDMDLNMRIKESAAKDKAAAAKEGAWQALLQKHTAGDMAGMEQTFKAMAPRLDSDTYKAMDSWIRQAKENATNKVVVPDNPAIMDKILRAAANPNTAQNVLNAPLEQLTKDLNPKQAMEIVRLRADLQEKINKGDDLDKMPKELRSAYTEARSSAKIEPFSPDDAKLYGQFMRMAGGKDMSREEAQKVYQYLTQPVEVEGSGYLMDSVEPRWKVLANEDYRKYNLTSKKKEERPAVVPSNAVEKIGDSGATEYWAEQPDKWVRFDWKGNPLSDVRKPEAETAAGKKKAADERAKAIDEARRGRFSDAAGGWVGQLFDDVFSE